MLDFATKHFLVLSSILVVAFAALSMVALGAYLSVFDWNLIWLVEYSDLTKLILIGVAILSATLAPLLNQMQDAYAWIIKGAKEWKWVCISTLIFAILFQIFLVAYDFYRGSDAWTYHLFRTLSSVSFFLFIFILFNQRLNILSGNLWSIFNTLFFLVLLLGSVGTTYAYYVKDASKQTRTIETKNGTFANAKLILFLSHHVAFIVGKDVIVMPTSEIAKMTTHVD